jgi:methyltransferase (TIGR00027 family)
MMVNLAAGLDSRPYRLDLPPSLRWVEVDLAEILDPKVQVLANETPHCQLEIITQHLGEEAQRRALFTKLHQQAEHIAVISEGLLVYLDEERVTALAADLHVQPHFEYWLVEIISPAVLAYINRMWQHIFKAANARMSFAPAHWRAFYHDRGWEAVEFEEMAKTARTMNREPGMMKTFRIVGQMFPEWSKKQATLWESGVALLRRR